MWMNGMNFSVKGMVIDYLKDALRRRLSAVMSIGIVGPHRSLAAPTEAPVVPPSGGQHRLTLVPKRSAEAFSISER